MWPFPRPRRLEPDWTGRLEALEKQVKVIVVEWDEWYDKYRRLYARLAKRASDAEKAAEDDPRPANGRPPARTLSLLAEALLRGPNNPGR